MTHGGETNDVLVIGAGHNGLTAAAYLARQGRHVQVLEAAPSIGGMTTTEALIPEAPNHLVNTCAMDMFLIRGFSVPAELDLARYGYRQIELDPQSVWLEPDGGSIAFWRDPRRTAREISRFSEPDARAFIDLMEMLDGVLDMAVPMMGTNPVRPEPRALAKSLRAVGRHRKYLKGLPEFGLASGAEILEERFRHPAVISALAGASFGAPIWEPGSAMFLAYWAWFHRFGAGRVIGGTGQLPAALARCLEAAGGTIRTEAVVSDILVRGERAVGVRLNTGEEIRARAVVAACDPKQALERMLPARTLSPKLEARVRSIPTEGSASLRVDVALRGKLSLPVHTKWRDDDLDLREPYIWRGTYEEQKAAARSAARGQLPAMFPYIATVPTSTDPTQAPEGQDTLYLYASRLPLDPIEPWDRLEETAVKQLLADAATFYTGLEELEIGRWVETPPKMTERTRATNGNWQHVDFQMFRAGPLRPALGFAGYKTPVPGLFLSSAGSHPGCCVSGVQGRLAAKSVQTFLRKN
ncbi:MAG TPA: NAD(P)/FAD-dependent oxidoreductase [Pseudonocardia sp.]|nr:NAD(P)/FAD-dependent oxidoreductase [Pseudonocardia sp.]